MLYTQNMKPNIEHSKSCTGIFRSMHFALVQFYIDYNGETLSDAISNWLSLSTSIFWQATYPSMQNKKKIGAIKVE